MEKIHHSNLIIPEIIFDPKNSTSCAGIMDGDAEIPEDLVFDSNTKVLLKSSSTFQIPLCSLSIQTLVICLLKHF